MDHKQRSGLAGGILLILVGLVFLAFQLVPGLRATLRMEITWPLIVVAVGVGLLLIGLMTGAPGMAVPAMIVGGIGGILYWQNATRPWMTWADAGGGGPGVRGRGTLPSQRRGKPRHGLQRQEHQAD